MLYRITLYVPSKFDRCFDAVNSFTVGTKRAVELEAAKLLPVSYQTPHSARYARLPYMKVTNAKTHERVAIIDTPIRYVLSCGDLGYAP